jgi:hypothetical protein
LTEEFNLISSRDLATIITFAVLNFVFGFMIGQVPRLITGIPGIGYAFTVVYSVTIAVSFLMYEGRRWRMFAQGFLFTLLSLTTVQSDILAGVISSTISVFALDLVFNSVYISFKKRGQLARWAIFGQVFYWTLSPFVILLTLSLFYPINGVITTWFIPVMSIMLPVMIIEAIVGGYMGYKIYRRVEKISSN